MEPSFGEPDETLKRFIKDAVIEGELCFAVEDGEVFDFRGMRLDWFRLQVGIGHFLSLSLS